MLTPLEITFHGLDRSDAVEARIREKFERIEQHFDRITRARVVIEAPTRRGMVPKLFNVRIEIGIPGHPPIKVDHEPDVEHSQTDVMISVRDAFAAAMRQVDDLVAKMDKPARREQARRRPARAASREEA